MERELPATGGINPEKKGAEGEKTSAPVVGFKTFTGIQGGDVKKSGGESHKYVIYMTRERKRQF